MGPDRLGNSQVKASTIILMETEKADQSYNSTCICPCASWKVTVNILDKVPGQVPHHPSNKLMENTLFQLWCQKLADNTVASLLAFHYLQVYIQPDKAKTK